jgi:hypothetical protein
LRRASPRIDSWFYWLGFSALGLGLFAWLMAWSLPPAIFFSQSLLLLGFFLGRFTA